MAYRFIDKYGKTFGVRWLLRRMKIYPNAYYYYRKHQKTEKQVKREKVLEKIKEIYHKHSGVPGHRQMQIYLKREGYSYSKLTIHRYMNRELQLRSIVRRRKPDYTYGEAHKIFENLLQQDFHAEKPNQKWCTDFTYLYLSAHEVRYNCTIIDLYDRSVVASLTDRRITSELATRTMEKALAAQGKDLKGILLHSDQGSQFTSKAFVEFCENHGVVQSMSKAGYPYDNAPMERYFNTLKNECTNLHDYATEEELYTAVEEFAYVQYNHRRPHSYNGCRTPYEVRRIS